jgi:hypothetical protein
MKVYIAHEVDQEAVERVKSFLKWAQLNDIDFSSVKFEILRDDFTWIDNENNDVYHAAALFNAIRDKIDNYQYEPQQNGFLYGSNDS